MGINIKKYTKEQMAGMVDAAQAANAELERQVAALGDRIDKQNDALSEYANRNMNLKADISALRGKLADTEKALGRSANEASQLARDLQGARMLVLDLRTEVAVARNHPWKHLWECVKGSLGY